MPYERGEWLKTEKKEENKGMKTEEVRRFFQLQFV
jgi:hypothetical protein